MATWPLNMIATVLASIDMGRIGISEHIMMMEIRLGFGHNGQSQPLTSICMQLKASFGDYYKKRRDKH